MVNLKLNEVDKNEFKEIIKEINKESEKYVELDRKEALNEAILKELEKIRVHELGMIYHDLHFIYLIVLILVILYIIGLVISLFV
jgi:hypothetical protein